MGHNKRTKKNLKAELAEAKLSSRNGLVRLIAAIAAILVILVGKEILLLNGVEWVTNSGVNLACYAIAVVLACVAGFGARDWSRASKRVKELEAMLAR